MIDPVPLQVTVSLVSLLGLCMSVLALATVWRRRLHDEQDAQANRLDALSERLRALESAHVRAQAPRHDEARLPSVRRVDRPDPTYAAGPTLIAVPNLAVEQGGEASSAADLGRRFAAVWERAEAGESAESIARATGQPIGQVDLILGLKRQLAANVGARLP